MYKLVWLRDGEVWTFASFLTVQEAGERMVEWAKYAIDPDVLMVDIAEPCLPYDFVL